MGSIKVDTVEITEDTYPLKVYSTLLEARKQVEPLGRFIAKSKDLASLKIGIRDNGGYFWLSYATDEVFIYRDPENVFISRLSLADAELYEATCRNAGGQDFFLNERRYRELLSDSIRVSHPWIPTRSFGKHPLTRFLFGEHAKEFGKSLKGKGIELMGVDPEIPTKEKPFPEEPIVKPVYFSSALTNFFTLRSGKGFHDSYQFLGV